ncbi:antitoxin family protein [Palaeococcus sp. (in: euryarchaeotes)]|uniref:antitoxin family protein n=1 Tax=Palaeococcus sp. (in: euryarchaeotes) TaxID=2820298 RepID=UPI0025EFBBE4|nr:antitoxin family protein [Palaeococcus sp. (in: euryarchaeotes)]
MGNIMSEIIEVVYENGVLKPLKKLPFKEGEKLIVEIKRGDKKKLLDELEGSIKLKKKIRLEEILKLEDELWLST